MNKRRQAAEETKKKIVDAAEKLIAEKGFDNVSVDDITSFCGVAKGTFYVYFKRKEDVVQDIGYAYFSAVGEEILAMKESGMAEKLRRYSEKFMHGVQRCGIRICRQWIKNVLDPADLPENYPSKYEFDVAMLENILQDAVEIGQLSKETPVETLAHLLISQLYGMMTCWCMSGGTFEPKDWVGRFADEQTERLFAPYIIKN